MIESSTRPLTPDERALLEQRVDPSSRFASSRGAALLGAWMAFFAVAVVAKPLPVAWISGPRWWVVPVAGFTAAGVAYAVIRVKGLWFLNLRPSSPEYADRVRADLARGVAEVLVCEVVEAVRVEEAEDEGSQYLLRLADGRAAFRQGQDLYELEDAGEPGDDDMEPLPPERRFPRTRLTIVRAPVSGEVLDFDYGGDYLPPAAERPPFTEAEHEAGLVPYDGEVFDGARYERLRRP